jgi:hypothetical protein
VLPPPKFPGVAMESCLLVNNQLVSFPVGDLRVFLTF